MTAKTYSPRESEIDRRWYVVDAADETLGRLAVSIPEHAPSVVPVNFALSHGTIVFRTDDGQKHDHAA